MGAPPPIVSHSVGIPEYVERREHGRTTLTLMEKVGVIERTPAWHEPVLVGEVQHEDFTELIIETKYHPPMTRGWAHWREV